MYIFFLFLITHKSNYHRVNIFRRKRTGSGVEFSRRAKTDNFPTAAFLIGIRGIALISKRIHYPHPSLRAQFIKLPLARAAVVSVSVSSPSTHVIFILYNPVSRTNICVGFRREKPDLFWKDLFCRSVSPRMSEHRLQVGETRCTEWDAVIRDVCM